MAQTQAQAPDADATNVLLNEATDASRTILADIGVTLMNITERTKELAVIVMRVRVSINRETKSKKTDKVVTVRDLDGRSGTYRQWYREGFTPLVDELIPASYKRGVLQALQNHVQALQKEEGTRTELEHLGLRGVTKDDTRKAKNDAANRPSEAEPIGEQIASEDNARAAKLVEVAAVVARMADLLATRWAAEVETMSKGDRAKVAQYAQQAGASLVGVVASPEREKVAA